MSKLRGTALVYLLLAAPLFVLGFWIDNGGHLLSSLPFRQVLGTSIMFIILPSYLLWVMDYQRRRSLVVLDELQPYGDLQLAHTIRRQSQQLSWWIGALVVLGCIYGFSQNSFFLERMLTSDAASLLDWQFTISNAIVWGVVALVISWRLAQVATFFRFARTLKIGIHQLYRFRPLARMATSDVLLVVGALAITPLQSLDAEFRLVNYRSGTLVGVFSALTLFIVPLLGARINIAAKKTAAIEQQRQRIEALDAGTDVVQMEAHLAHLNRLENLSTWPIDVRLVLRVLGYLIIAPAAWVAAALVENFIDSL